MTGLPETPSVDVAPTRLGEYELLAELGRGSSAVVHRGRHLATGTPVAVKQLFLNDPDGLEGLRREIAILGRLRHPGVVRMLEHGVEDGTPWCAMEMVEGRSLEALWAAPLDAARVTASLRILRELCEALAFIHGEGVVHRDLKPANVLVRDDGRPVLVDFGFVSGFAGRTGREILEAGGGLCGSLSYIAPEQLHGEFVDARADLYAFGCMLYEAVTGRPPFSGSPAAVAQAHLDVMPRAPSSRGADVSPDLDALVRELLAKAPRDRPGYASDVARRLDATIGDGQRSTPAPVTYLYRASFVGRTAPLRTVGERLDEAARGRAACVLVAGESGVGKTRLAMEATRVAASRRFAVVTGECAPAAAGGGGPLHPFLPALRRLADVGRQTGPAFVTRVLGGSVGILRAIAPELASLPGLDAEPRPAALPASAARERLVRTLGSVLAAWASEAPLMIVLDDLQWADELTIAVLEMLVAAPPAGPLVVLGLLRRDEAPARLEAFESDDRACWIALDRLDEPALHTLVSDMLAMPRAPGRLVDFLATHTEGNPFFVSEYLRTAVGAGVLVRGDGGGWSVSAGDPAYASLSLPHTLRALVERRLRDLAEPARRLVAGAAVLGRDFDPAVAADLVALDASSQVEALAVLRARQVAEAGRGGLWRFAHDKLREVAYDVIPAEHRRSLHRAAATAIEGRVAGDPRAPDHYATIAHHCAAGGDARRAGEYFGRAGEHSLARGDLDAARRQLGEAIANVPPSGSLDLQRAHWFRLLAETNAGSDLATAIDQTGDAMRLLGERVPRGNGGWLAHTVAELVRRGWSRAARDPAVAIEAAFAAKRAANSFYFQFDVLRGVACSLRCVNLAESAGEPGLAALAYAQLGYIVGGAGVHRIATRCFARAHAQRGARATDPSDFAAGLYFHAMYEMGLARWETSEALAREAVERLQAIGNYDEEEVAATVLANTLHFGGHIAAAETQCLAVETSARRRGHAQHLAWGHFLRGRERFALGDVPGARAAVELGYERLLPTRDFVSLVMCEGLLARVRWSDGDRAGALQAAEAFEARLAERRLVPLAQCLGGYWCYADLRLRVWQSSPSHQNAEAAARACGVLRRFARIFTIARPAALRAVARRRAVLGQRRRARRAWLRSAALARTLAMPYDEAGALLDLAIFDDDPQRRATATDAFDRLGCGEAVATVEGFAA